MAKTFQRLSAKVNSDPRRRERVEEQKRAIGDALGLGNLRETFGATQQEMASALGVSQANVSRLERQQDLYLSSLEAYVAALDGHLEIAAVFPDRRVNLEVSRVRAASRTSQTRRPRAPTKRMAARHQDLSVE
jgi:DNA-binding XRE family transcriptional regulator